MNKIIEGLEQDDAKVLVNDIEVEIKDPNTRNEKTISDIMKSDVNPRFASLAGAFLKFQNDIYMRDMTEVQNDYSCWVSKVLCSCRTDVSLKCTGDRDYEDTAERAVSFMEDMAPSLQQSFAEIVFTYIQRNIKKGKLPQNIIRVLENNGLDEGWELCPVMR